MSTPRRWVRTAAYLLALALAGGLAGCTGDESDPPTPSTSSTSGGSATTAPAQGAEQITQQYLKIAEPEVLASVKGSVTTVSEQKVPGTVDVLAVQAGPDSTAVRWRISSDTDIPGVSNRAYAKEGWSVPDTSTVALVAQSANLRLQPSTWWGTESNSNDCTCAWVPHELGPAGVQLSSLFPALPESVTEVQLRVPGFPAVTAPVTRG